MIKQIHPQNIKPGDLILDVRMPAERAEIHLDIPFFAVELSDLDCKKFIRDHKLDGKKCLNILCRTGRRAALACAMFQKAGFENVAVIQGGIDNAKNFLPVIKSDRMSLERQVRISAGSLIVIGATLGALVHNGFYIIPFFVGIMLVFAGITDWCGMAKILQYMPWNQSK
ncbi:MAG: DUF2892 domain-containing protein [Alphaproteobacteria bacterium]|nr:DUF2892 domain-containing protein [Alphaproteobacteria bacterium]